MDQQDHPDLALPQTPVLFPHPLLAAFAQRVITETVGMQAKLIGEVSMSCEERTSKEALKSNYWLN